MYKKLIKKSILKMFLFSFKFFKNFGFFLFLFFFILLNLFFLILSILINIIFIFFYFLILFFYFIFKFGFKRFFFYINSSSKFVKSLILKFLTLFWFKSKNIVYLPKNIVYLPKNIVYLPYYSFKSKFGFNFNFFFFIKKIFLNKIEDGLKYLGFSIFDTNFIVENLEFVLLKLREYSYGDFYSELSFLFLFSQCLVFIKFCGFLIDRDIIISLIRFLYDLEYKYLIFGENYSLNIISSFFYEHFPSFMNKIIKKKEVSFYLSCFLNLIFFDINSKTPQRVLYRSELFLFLKSSFIFLFNNSITKGSGVFSFFNFNEISNNGLILEDSKLYTDYSDLGFLHRGGFFLNVESVVFFSVLDLFRIYKAVFTFIYHTSNWIFPGIKDGFYIHYQDVGVYFLGVFVFNNGLRFGGFFKNKSFYVFNAYDCGVKYDLSKNPTYYKEFEDLRHSFFFCNNTYDSINGLPNDIYFENVLKGYQLNCCFFEGVDFNIYVHMKFIGHSKFRYSYTFLNDTFFIVVHKGKVFLKENYFFLDLSYNFFCLEGFSDSKCYSLSVLQRVLFLEKNLEELRNFYGPDIFLGLLKERKNRNIISMKKIDSDLEVFQYFKKFKDYFEDRGLIFFKDISKWNSDKVFESYNKVFFKILFNYSKEFNKEINPEVNKELKKFIIKNSASISDKCNFNPKKLFYFFFKRFDEKRVIKTFPKKVRKEFFNFLKKK